VVVKN